MRHDTSTLVMRANTVVSSVAPATIRKIPKTSIPVDWPEKEKSPNPTVEMVSTVKLRAVRVLMWPPCGVR